MTAKKRDSMNADLLRQRRNLLIISIILISIQIAGVRLKNGISIVGVTIEFTHPERIIWGLWILWLYFLLRYFQYFKEENDLGIHEEMSEWIEKRIPNFDPFKNGFKNWVEWKFIFFWSIYTSDIQSKNQDQTYKHIKSTQDPNNKIFKLSLSLRSFLHVALKTPRFTDYVLPFFVAFAPLLLIIFNNLNYQIW